MTYWLFDIDGTLVDSTPAVERAWRIWAAENDLDAAAILQVSHGRRAKDTLADFVTPECVDAAYQRLLALEMADLDSVVALPEAAELLAARRLGADPAECIVVEDAPAGLEAGCRAGCRVIAVATSHSPGQLAGYEVLPDLTCLHIPT